MEKTNKNQCPKCKEWDVIWQKEHKRFVCLWCGYEKREGGEEVPEWLKNFRKQKNGRKNDNSATSRTMESV